MRLVKFRPLYLAGVTAGFGLALFMTFIVSGIEGFEFAGLTRTITGAVGLLLLISGGIWNMRLQGMNKEAN